MESLEKCRKRLKSQSCSLQLYLEFSKSWGFSCEFRPVIKCGISYEKTNYQNSCLKCYATDYSTQLYSMIEGKRCSIAAMIDCYGEGNMGFNFRHAVDPDNGEMKQMMCGFVS